MAQWKHEENARKQNEYSNIQPACDFFQVKRTTVNSELQEAMDLKGNPSSPKMANNKVTPNFLQMILKNISLILKDLKVTGMSSGRKMDKITCSNQWSGIENGEQQLLQCTRDTENWERLVKQSPKLQVAFLKQNIASG